MVLGLNERRKNNNKKFMKKICFLFFMTSYYSSLNFVFMKTFAVGVHNFNYCIKVSSNSATKLVVRGKQYFTNQIKPFGRFLDDHRQSYALICKSGSKLRPTTNCYRYRFLPESGNGKFGICEFPASLEIYIWIRGMFFT